MAPVIWGLDLAEFKFSKFKSSNMWNKEYHLRRTKFIVYQCALILCVVSESLGTDALSDYVDEQKKIQKIDPSLYNYNNDYIGAASYNIFAGVFIAFIFGAAFFFDLMWPERKESHGVRIAWKVCGVLSVIFHLASAITLTVITFTRRSYINDANGQRVSPQRSAHLVSQYSKASQAPLIYGQNTRAIAAVAFVWPGWLSVLGSCILLFLSIDNTEFGRGPKSKSARERDGITGADEESACGVPDEKENLSEEGEHQQQQQQQQMQQMQQTRSVPQQDAPATTATADQAPVLSASAAVAANDPTSTAPSTGHVMTTTAPDASGVAK